DSPRCWLAGTQRQRRLWPLGPRPRSTPVSGSCRPAWRNKLLRYIARRSPVGSQGSRDGGTACFRGEGAPGEPAPAGDLPGRQELPPDGRLAAVALPIGEAGIRAFHVVPINDYRNPPPASLPGGRPEHARLRRLGLLGRFLPLRPRRQVGHLERAQRQRPV